VHVGEPRRPEGVGHLRLDARVQMNRVDEPGAGKANRQPRNGRADALQAWAEVLTAMARHENDVLPGVEGIGRQPGHVNRAPANGREHAEEGVHHGVPGDVDAVGRDPLPDQRKPVCGRWGEVQRRKPGGQRAVGFLRPGRGEVSRPQPGLDVRDRDPVVEGGQACAEGGRGVALDQEESWRVLREVSVQRADHSGGQRAERVARPHQAEVVVHRDPERIQHLFEHLAMLTRATDAAGQSVLPQLEDDGSELDRFRTGSEHGQDRPAITRAHVEVCSWDSPGDRSGSHCRAGKRA